MVLRFWRRFGLIEFECGQGVRGGGERCFGEACFEENVVESFEELFAELGDGDFLDDDLGELEDETGLLGGGDGVGFGFAESVGIDTFEHPGGGAPVFGVSAGAVDVFDVDELGGVFREGEFFGEVGVAFGGVEDGFGMTSDRGSGGGSAATGLEQGEDEGSLLVVEGERSTGGCHAEAPIFRG
jgi:hypothetical protein